jgi:L-ribulose-5-phosphate 3-epimerase
MGKLRLGGSTFSFMWTEPAPVAMRRLRGIGLNDFDVLMVPGHLWPAALDAGARRALAAELRADGIRIESLNLPALDLNLASCVPEVRAYGVAQYRAALHLGGELGGRGVVLVPGRVSSLLPPATEDTLGWLSESLDAILRTADEVGQTVFLESHPLTPVPDAERIARFLERVAHPRLTVAYDVANAEFIGEDQVAALRRLAPRLGQVHLSDGTRGAWRHDRAGLGTVDFAAVLATLEEIGFSGVAVAEVISADPLADTATTLEALAAAAGRARASHRNAPA